MEIIQEIGAYAGLAAVVGLAILSALYFSQARDVKRLREWAGRAPERTEVPAPKVTATPQAKPATQAKPKPAAQPAAAQAAAAGAGAVAARPAAATPAAQAATAEKTKQPAVPAAAGAKGGGPATKAPTVPARPATPAASRPGTGPRPGQTAIIPPSQQQSQEPWYRRISPRYLALAAVGVVIIGGAGAFGVSQLAKEEAPAPTSERENAANDAAERERPAREAAVVPSRVTVSVLNGTTVPGLAAQLGDKVKGFGFKIGNVTNNPDQQRAESVVLFTKGADREAAAVGKRLGITQREPIDAASQELAGDARVVVIAGADQTQ